nr:MAG TPA: hypothetical protein [Caudoviricetes sp.]
MADCIVKLVKIFLRLNKVLSILTKSIRLLLVILKMQVLKVAILVVVTYSTNY